MTRRRGKGEGSIRERADGRWEVRIDLGRGLDGRRRQKSAFAATQAEAVQALRKLGGRGPPKGSCSRRAHLRWRVFEDWFALYGDTWRPNTRRNYRIAIVRYLVKAFAAACRAPFLPHLHDERLKAGFGGEVGYRPLEDHKTLTITAHGLRTPVANVTPLVDELLDGLVESHDWLLQGEDPEAVNLS